jgi:hypothetical protein
MVVVELSESGTPLSYWALTIVQGKGSLRTSASYMEGQFTLRILPGARARAAEARKWNAKNNAQIITQNFQNHTFAALREICRLLFAPIG